MQPVQSNEKRLAVGNKKHVYVRYTGSRLAGKRFAAGTGAEFTFSALEGYSGQIISETDWLALKQRYELEFITTPMETRKKPMALSTPIGSSDLISEPDKRTLLDAGLETLGEVLAVADLSFVPNSQKLLNALCKSFGLPYEEEAAPVDPEPVKVKPSKAAKAED